MNINIAIVLHTPLLWICACVDFGDLMSDLSELFFAAVAFRSHFLIRKTSFTPNVLFYFMQWVLCTGFI